MLVRRSLASLCLLCLSAAACDEQTPSNPPAAAAGAPTASPGLTVAPVVYDADDRLDWYAHPDAAVRSVARAATAVMIGTSDLSMTADSVTIDPGPSLGASKGLCADQRFWQQPTAGVCSGTLIDHNLLLTAGHCVQSLGDCAGSYWVFDWLYEDENTQAVVDPSDVFRCVDVVAHGGFVVDFAVLQLDRSAQGRTPAKMAPAGPVSSGDPLILAGYPNGIPLKIDSGGAVAHSAAAAAADFDASVDSFSGNSGSGVFTPEMAVVGVLINGASDYDDIGSCSVVNVLPSSEAEEGVAMAHHAQTALCDAGFPSQALCGLSPICGDAFCTDGDTLANCPEDCTGLAAVPSEWHCNLGWFDAGDDCDCGCGAYDPDCDKANLDTVGCAPGGVCMDDGNCTIPIPADWTCRDSFYDAGDDCDCDCGAYDPDCDDPSLRVVGCTTGTACSDQGSCEVPIPDGWFCRSRYYAAGDDCDCGCGAYDPDCDDPSLSVENCPSGDRCQPDGTCENSPPPEWICSSRFYGVGDDCDCNCGAWDPDCADPSLRTFNCLGGLVCGEGGACVEADDITVPVVEPEPDVMDGDTSEGDSGGDTSGGATPDTAGGDDDGDDAASQDGGAGGEDSGDGDGATIRGVQGTKDDGCAGGGSPSSPPWWAASLLVLLGWQRRRAHSS